MSDYKLVDIHFHTDDSFDAFSNCGKNQPIVEKSGIIDIMAGYEKDEVEESVKLVCKTDHNILNYPEYKRLAAIFQNKGIKLLPGIEMNLLTQVHWIFIFNDEQLDKVIDSSTKKTLGQLLDEKINSDIYHYSGQPSLKEREDKQKMSLNVDDVIKVFNKVGVDYLAIPHFIKEKGLFKYLTDDINKLVDLQKYVNDNIINGFESKNFEKTISDHITKTSEYLKKHIEAAQKTENEIKKESDALCVYNAAKEILENEDIAQIFGSDYHGKKGSKYEKEYLFIMKSEATFEGLRFALLDQSSRIFSLERYRKLRKTASTVIKKIVLSIDGTDKTLEFGDGLNSIIGSRGSGKTYLLSSIIGKQSKYQESNIYKSITIKEVCFANSKPSQKSLEENQFDYISQKNSDSASFKNLFSILEKAPYDSSDFTENLKRFNDNRENIQSSEEIRPFFQSVNKLIDKIICINNEKAKKFDFSFCKEYDRFYIENDETVRINRIFISQQNLAQQKLIAKQTDRDKVKKFSEKLKENRDFLEGFFSITEVVESLKENSISDVKEKLLKLIDLSPSIEEKINNRCEILDKIKKHINNICERLKSKFTNEQESLDSKVRELSDNIANAVKALKEYKKAKSEFDEKNKGSLRDTMISEFNIGQHYVKIKIEKNLDLNSTDESQINEIFDNYNSVKASYLREFLKRNDFGKYYLENIFEKHDKRKKEKFHLVEPTLKKMIYIKDNESDYKDWETESPGQKADLILSLALDSKSHKILIIDQPEDDLDNETVYKKIVSKLSELKLHRQVIIVTHNANLCITADSDRIITCQNNNNHFSVDCDSMESTRLHNYESINTNIKGKRIIDIASIILDGGKEAIRKRVHKIGYKSLFFKEEN